MKTIVLRIFTTFGNRLMLKKQGAQNDKEQLDTEENCGARAVAFCVFHWLDSENAELV